MSALGVVALEADGGRIVHGVSHGRSPGPNLVMSVRAVHLGLSSERPLAPVNVWAF
jgi:hypothetical protein